MYQLIRPLLFLLDAEDAHRLVLRGAGMVQKVGPALSLLHRLSRVPDKRLVQDFCNLRVDHPVGLAAGMDKNAELVPFWEALGCGFVEVGSVSARPAAGNPRPRAFRLPADRALINRMGLNNEGAALIAGRLREVQHRCPLGINLAKTHDPTILGAEAIADFCESFRLLAPLADYVTLNISCPNTAEGKTFEQPQALSGLLRAIFALRREVRPAVPVLIKLSPLEADSLLDELLAVAREHGVAGLVVTNTRPVDGGGLSGPPLARRSTELIRHIHRRTGGTLPIIGVGGVDSPQSAYEKIRAGASLVQVYTGLVYQGPGLIRRIHRGLLRLLARDGLPDIRAAVGAGAR